VLVTTLTKRMAEDLTEYYSDLGLKVRYLHSDITTLERMDIIRDLRLGHFDVLVGITCCAKVSTSPRCRWWPSWTPTRRVSAIGPIAHSDLRPCGAQRQRHGHPLRRHRHALDAAGHRRNQPPPPYSAGPQPGTRITPESVHKAITGTFDFGTGQPPSPAARVAEEIAEYGSLEDVDAEIRRLEKQMHQAARELDFERAADLRIRSRACSG